MRTVNWDIGIILSFGIFCFNASALEREGANPEAAGEVVSVHGRVYVRQDAEGKDKAIPLRPAQNVFAGDVINTASDGAIKILLKDKSIVDLGASSLFKVAGFKPNSGTDREVDLDMKFGRLRVSVSKKITGGGKFNVKTRAATMGVRGTEFVVNSALGDAKSGANAPKTDVTVLQGRVDVQAPASAGAAPKVNSLTAGGRISAQVGVAPSLVQLNTQQMASIAAVNKVADNTFAKAITIEAPENNAGRAPASEGSKPAGGSSAGAASDTGSANASSVASEQPAAGTLASAVADIAASAPTVPVSFTEIGVPGAPSVVNVTTNPVNQVNRSYRVTVIVGQ